MPKKINIETLKQKIAKLEAENRLLKEQLKNSSQEEKNEFSDIYSHFFNTLRDFFWILDQQANIIFVNDYAVEKLGYSREELYGKSVLLVHPEERRDEAMQIVGAMLQGKAEFCPIPIVSKTGKYIPVETRVVMGEWKGQNVMFGVSKDISDLKLSEEKFSKAFYITSNPTAISEFETGKYLDVNEAFLKTFGLKKEEVIGKTSVEVGILTPKTRQQITNAYKKHNELKEEEVAINFRGKKFCGLFSGTTFFLQEKKCWITTMRNITAERKISEQNQMLATLVEQSPSPIIVTDTNGNIEYTNPQFTKSTGYSAQEVRGQKTSILKSGEMDYRFYKNLWETITKGKTWKGEFINKRKNGEIYSEHTIISPIKNEKGETVNYFAFKDDVYEKEILEEKLKATQERWKFAIEGSNLGLWDWNLLTNEVYFSPMWKKMLGFADNEIKGSLTEWEKRIHPEDKKQVYEKINFYMTNQTEIYENIHRVQCKNGNYKWILDRGKIVERDEKGKPIRMIGTHTDISEQKRIQTELEVSELKYKNLVNHSPSIIYKYSVKEGALFWSPSTEQVLGYTPEDLYTKPFIWTDSIHKDDKKRVNKAIEEYIKGKNLNIEYRIQAKNGKWVWLNDIGIHRYQTETETVIEGQAIDITDRKNAELALQKSESQLKNILNSFNDSVYIISDNYEITYANQHLINRIGKDRIGEKCYKALYNQKEKCLWCKFENIKKNHPVITYDVYIPETKEYKNSINILLDDNSKLTFHFDITDRITAQKALEESEARFSSFFHKDKSIKLLIDPQTGNIEDANQSALEFYGYDQYEIQKMKISEINTLSEAEIKQEMKLAKSQNKSYFNFKHRIASGEIRDVEVYSTTVEIEHSGKTVLFSIIHDITDKLKTEIALKKSEAKYRMLAENASDIIWVLDPETLKFKYISPVAEKIYGHKIEEIYNLEPKDIYTKKSLRIIEKGVKLRLELYKKGIKKYAERKDLLESRHKNGEIIYVEANTKIVENNGDYELFGISRDITEKIKAEQAIKESEAKFRNLFENSHDALFVLDGNNKFSDCNPRAIKMTGYSKQEIIGQTPMLFSPEYQAKNVRSEDLIIEYGIQSMKQETVNFEWNALKKDGTELIVEISFFNYKGKSKIFTYASVKDITDRKRAEQALQQSEKKFRDLVQNQGEGVAIVDTQENITFANPAALGIFEEEMDEVLRKNLKNFVKNEDWNKVLQETNSRKKGKKGTYELTIKTQKGENKQIRVSATPIFDEKENFKGTLSVFVDITKMKQTEQELRELVATKDKFFNIIAHDLRSPFSAILGFSDILMSKYDKYSPQKKQQFLKAINDSASSTYKLITDLLDWARSQTGKIQFKPEKYQIYELAQEVVQSLNQTARKKNITITNALDTNTEVLADKQMIETIFRNLISNAIKFSNPKGGIIIYGEITDQNITVSVSDSGVGIKPERIGGLFKIDQNTSTKGTADEKGTGLGLILCKEFIDKHNGKIWVESQVGKGSTFSFSLPK